MTYQYCAQIESNTVINVVACDSVDWCVSNIGGNWLPVYDSNYCGIGWTWDGEKFMPPKTEEVENEII